jgi:hypothetical protein
MRRALFWVGIVLSASVLTLPNAIAARRSSNGDSPAGTHIIKGPKLELARYGMAIIRWTTNDPGGTDLHYAVVHYGTDPEDMSQIARSPTRLRKSDATATFRVRIQGLKAGTTYYYWVESFQANGISDGAKSGMNQFIMPEHPYILDQ